MEIDRKALKIDGGCSLPISHLSRSREQNYGVISRALDTQVNDLRVHREVKHFASAMLSIVRSTDEVDMLSRNGGWRTEQSEHVLLDCM